VTPGLFFAHGTAPTIAAALLPDRLVALHLTTCFDIRNRRIAGYPGHRLLHRRPLVATPHGLLKQGLGLQSLHIPIAVLGHRALHRRSIHAKMNSACPTHELIAALTLRTPNSLAPTSWKHYNAPPTT
jgi:hypothetical protein